MAVAWPMVGVAPFLLSGAVSSAPALLALGSPALAATLYALTNRGVRFVRQRTRPLPIAQLASSSGAVAVRGRVERLGVPRKPGELVAHGSATMQSSTRFAVRDATGMAIVDDDLLVLPDGLIPGRSELRVGDEVTVFGPIREEQLEVMGGDYRTPSRERVLVFDGRIGAPVVLSHIRSPKLATSR